MLGITHIYFLGIGGIGMSALARYCRAKGYTVAGYDRTVSPLTKELETEGIAVCYSEDLADVRGLRKDATLVVRTPAVPDDEAHYVWFREQGFDIVKRAELLGRVTCKERALCVAGTHGKTTTSTMLAHLLASSHIGTNAFLGGISNNYASNLLLNTSSDLVVVEADEYDRSFHHLRPYMSVITSIDPDHLDIYGSSAAYQEGFDVYAGLVEDTIVLKQGYELDRSRVKAKIYTYSATDKADFYASNIRVADGSIMFDLVARGEVIKDLLLGVPVWVNIENSVAASALALLNGVTEDELRAGLAGYKGVYRRFNIHVNTPEVAYVDDYAHHPTELQASISSIRKLYPERHIIGIFQPHLYTRTRDFAEEFKSVLGSVDELVLLPIYPARELPIAGVTSEMLGGKVVQKPELVEYIKSRVAASDKPVAVLTLGAGDIDRLVEPMAQALRLVNNE